MKHSHLNYLPYANDKQALSDCVDDFSQKMKDKLLKKYHEKSSGWSNIDWREFVKKQGTYCRECEHRIPHKILSGRIITRCGIHAMDTCGGVSKKHYLFLPKQPKQPK